jgi:hypothetical protein
MNTFIKRHGKYLLYILLVAMPISCGNEYRQSTNQKKKPIGEWYKSGNNQFNDEEWDLQIVKVRDCEYVLWHNWAGSDMEHYEGCDNPKHCN